MKPQHTPTPWTVSERQAMGIGHQAVISEMTDEVIARMDFLNEDDGKSNAAFIVRAVNAHEDMKAALEQCEGFLKAMMDLEKHKGARALLVKVLQALKKGEEK